MELDHLVILVPDLARAINDYRDLGFTVTPGGAHADRLTENALIPFNDGTYLELIAFNDPGTPQLHRWWRFVAKGGGLIDYALHTSKDLATTVNAVASKGVVLDGPHDGGRQRPDGEQLKWRGAFSTDGEGLPFLIEDVTPRELRVPGGAPTEHPNGVQGIARVVVGVPDLVVASEQYATLLDQPVDRKGNDKATETSTSEFELGSATVMLSQPQARDLPLSHQILSRGAGIYAAWLRTDDDVATQGWLNADRAHGARLQLVRPQEVEREA